MFSGYISGHEVHVKCIWNINVKDRGLQNSGGIIEVKSYRTFLHFSYCRAFNIKLYKISKIVYACSDYCAGKL